MDLIRIKMLHRGFLLGKYVILYIYVISSKEDLYLFYLDLFYLEMCYFACFMFSTFNAKLCNCIYFMLSKSSV